MDKWLSAIILPALLMVLFTRVTYSRTVAFILTLTLIIISAIKGYINGWWFISIEAASLTLGLFFANQMTKKKKPKSVS